MSVRAVLAAVVAAALAGLGSVVWAASTSPSDAHLGERVVLVPEPPSHTPTSSPSSPDATVPPEDDDEPVRDADAGRTVAPLAPREHDDRGDQEDDEDEDDDDEDDDDEDDDEDGDDDD